jgi:hypothetical protein
MNRPGFQTEIDFILPKGYVDPAGGLHRNGVMRLATAADEILPLRDPRVQQNPAYLTIIVLARVIVRLGTLNDIDTRTIENLFASDLDYLQRLYESLNGAEELDGEPAAGIGGRLNGAYAGGIGALGEA